MNVKAATKRLLKVPLRALGMDVVRSRPPTAQPVFPPEELEMISAFGPQYKPENHWLAECGIKTVLDVGAHIGEFAQRIRTMLPNAELVCFEPLEEPFTKLTERLEDSQTSAPFAVHLVKRPGNTRSITMNTPQVHLCCQWPNYTRSHSRSRSKNKLK